MAMTSTANQDHAPRLPTLQDILAWLGLLVRLEHQVLWLLIAQAIAIGIFSLIIPLTVQELVTTFAFAIHPMMVATLAAVLMVIGPWRPCWRTSSTCSSRRSWA